MESPGSIALVSATFTSLLAGFPPPANAGLPAKYTTDSKANTQPIDRKRFPAMQPRSFFYDRLIF
jgi:hypothetical protein